MSQLLKKGKPTGQPIHSVDLKLGRQAGTRTATEAQGWTCRGLGAGTQAHQSSPWTESLATESSPLTASLRSKPLREQLVLNQLCVSKSFEARNSSGETHRHRLWTCPPISFLLSNPNTSKRLTLHSLLSTLWKAPPSSSDPGSSPFPGGKFDKGRTEVAGILRECSLEEALEILSASKMVAKFCVGRCVFTVNNRS